MDEFRYPGLQIEPHLVQQRREWRLQRVAWVLLYGLLVALILGLFGSGPLSTSALISPDGRLQLRYDRFLRHQSTSELQFTLFAEGEEVVLRISSDYIRELEIQEVSPQPQRVIGGQAFVAFVFAARPQQQFPVSIIYHPEKTGRLKAELAVGEAPPQIFTQFVYP